MKREESNIQFGIYLAMFLLIVLLTISFISAGFFDTLKKTITGKASSQLTNMSITVSGVNPAVIELVSYISDTLPTEGTNRSVVFYVTMYDANGVSDLNDSSVRANFSKAGEVTRNSSACTLVADIDANRANYSCNVNIQYWDEIGAWNVTVEGNDLGNKTTAINGSRSFNISQLKALVISPASLTWPAISPNATNQTSDNDPTTINNTGNFNGTIDVNAINLLGESDESYSLPARNFTVGLTSGGGNPECGGTAMVNATSTTVTSSVSNTGNLSLGSGVGQEQFYYCLIHVPANLSSQIYSTTTGGGWTILY